jgi:hypothetical protein
MLAALAASRDLACGGRAAGVIPTGLESLDLAFLHANARAILAGLREN